MNVFSSLTGKLSKIALLSSTLLMAGTAIAGKDYSGTVITELFSAVDVPLENCSGHWRTAVTTGAGISVTELPDQGPDHYGTLHNRIGPWNTNYWQDFGERQAGYVCGVDECPFDYDTDLPRYMGSNAKWDNFSHPSEIRKMNIPILFDRCGAGPCPNCGCGGIGNPCDPATGNKYQVETDYTSSVGLSVIRHYNSRNKVDVGFGTGWSASFSKHLEVERDYGMDVLIVRADTGRGEEFEKDHDTGLWSSDADTELSITEDSSGIQLIRKNGHIENYNAQGRLISETTPSGQTTTYSYNSHGYLTQVTSPFGQTLQIARYSTTSRILSITTPQGQVINYNLLNYGSYSTLTSVDYPDGNTRQYHYEDTEYPSHLTGITDENGDRYATFAYDSQGRAIRTEHADVTGTGPQEQFQIHYGSQ